MSMMLPGDLSDRVRAQIEAGHFQSEEQVLHEALATLEQRQQSFARLSELVRQAEDDVAAGRIGPFDRDELKREVRAQLESQGLVCR